MSDLISRSALIKEIETLKIRVTGLRVGKGVLSEFEKQYRKTIIRVIEEQPTTYDAEKVVEQLEARKSHVLKEFVLKNKAEKVKEFAISRINEIDGCIEIVRKGGKE